MSNTLTKWPGLGAALAAATQHAIPNNKPQRRKKGIIAHRVGTVDQAGGPLSRIIHDHITGRSAFEACHVLFGDAASRDAGPRRHMVADGRGFGVEVSAAFKDKTNRGRRKIRFLKILFLD